MHHGKAFNSPNHLVVKSLLMISGNWPYQKKCLKLLLRILVSLSVLSLEVPLVITIKYLRIKI